MKQIGIGLLTVACMGSALALSPVTHHLPSGIPTVILGHQDIYHRLLIQQQQVQTYQYQLRRDTQVLTQAEARLIVLEREAKNLHSGFNWVTHYSGKPLPKHVVFADHTGNKSVICQASYLNYRYPGMVTDKGCVITYAGKAIIQKDYRVLVADKQVKWVANKAVPPEPVQYRLVGFPMKPTKKETKPHTTWYQPLIGGYEYNHAVYICRTHMLGSWYVGKVVTGNCNVAWQNKEAVLPDYQVLTTGEKATKANMPKPRIIPMGPGPVKLGPNGKPV